jgi:DNA-binding CsgD family transcriptional regulator
MLSSSQLAQVEHASRALLSPLAVPDIDAWRSEVLGTLRTLLRADGGMFMLSTATQVHFSDRSDHRLRNAYDDFLAESTPQGPRLSDPVLQTWLDERRRVRQEVVTDTLVDRLLAPHGLALHDSPVYSEVMVPEALVNQRGMYVSFSGGEAMVQLGYARTEKALDHDASVALLHVLIPSFRAGLDALSRFDLHRHTLDAVSEPLAAFDADGRLLHQNPALTRLLDADAERDRIEVELRVLARRLRMLAFPMRHEVGGTAGPPTASREVATARGSYALRGLLLPPGGGGFGEAVLITVTLDAPPSLPDAEAIRARHGLTKREAEVALLLAGGLSNAEIAERLFVSPHTARHHVENVLGKLQLSSRAAVGARLMGTA